jgi:hypothetical protein
LGKHHVVRKFPSKEKCMLLINAFRKPGKELTLADCLIKKDEESSSDDEEPPEKRMRLKDGSQEINAEEPVAGTSRSGEINTSLQLERLKVQFEQHKAKSTQEIETLKAQLLELQGRANANAVNMINLCNPTNCNLL